MISYTSVTNQAKSELKKSSTHYLFASAGLFLINKIYARFSHGVSSDYMSWMFCIPLLGGTLFFLILRWLKPEMAESRRYQQFRHIYSYAISTFSTGCMIKGIVQIAGTDSLLIHFYWIAGSFFIVLSIWVLISIIRINPPAAYLARKK